MSAGTIVFDHPDQDYSAVDPDGAATGGIQGCVLGLAQALANRGQRVVLRHGGDRGQRGGGPCGGAGGALTLVAAGDDPGGEVALAIGINRPPSLPARHGALWFHNRTGLIRLARRGVLTAMLRRRPVAVFPSAQMEASTTRLLPVARRLVLRHGLRRAFLEVPAPRPPGPPLAVFASQPYRGLAPLLTLWRTHIRTALPLAELRVYAPKPGPLAAFAAHNGRDGITLVGSVGPAALAAALAAARVALVPGHRDETFCLVAAEALSLGTPVLTRGLGALGERVAGGGGVIAPSDQAFAAALIALLSDDARWQGLHRAALATPDRVGWDTRSAEWVAAFGLEQPDPDRDARRWLGST